MERRHQNLEKNNTSRIKNIFNIIHQKITKMYAYLLQSEDEDLMGLDLLNVAPTCIQTILNEKQEIRFKNLFKQLKSNFFVYMPRFKETPTLENAQQTLLNNDIRIQNSHNGELLSSKDNLYNINPYLRESQLLHLFLNLQSKKLWNYAKKTLNITICAGAHNQDTCPVFQS